MKLIIAEKPSVANSIAKIVNATTSKMVIKQVMVI